MAVNNTLLSSQLISKLEDENGDLQARFQLAQLAFSSSSIPIIRKEEIIIEWLSDKIRTLGWEGSQVPYDVLNSCVSGPRLLSLSLEIKRSVIDSLVEALTTPINNSNTVIENKRKECIISVLSSVYFQNIFYRDVQSLSKLVKQFCICSDLTSSDPNELTAVSEILLNFNKQCLLHEDLRYSFISEMMLPLCQTLSKITYKYKDCEQNIYDCMAEIVFREPDLCAKFIELYSCKKNSEDDSFTVKLISVLKKLPTSQNVEVVRVVFTLFLKAVFKNNENHSQIFKLFTILCSILGVTVVGMVSIDLKPKKNWTMENTFSVLSSMVQLLDLMKLSFNCTIDNDITLQIWLTSMIIGLSNINSGNLSSEFLKLITSILKSNPMIIENAHKPLCTQIMMCKKTDESVKKEYVALLKAIFDGSLLISRLPKFISKFLSCIEEYLQFSDTHIPFGIEDIFPKEITEHFCTTVSMMVGSQVLSTTKSLQYHLHLLCNTKLEASGVNFESDVILSAEIVSHLLNLFLNGVKIADFNTPTIVKDKFSSIVMDIGNSLEKFVEIILDRNYNDRLMSCLLKLCFSVGSSILLMWEYDRDERRALEDTDSIPTNLCYIHSYINPDVWEIIASRVALSDSDIVKNNFYMLIMQKMAAVAQIEEGANGPGTVAARYLLANASPSWHWDNATALAPLLQDNELLGLLECLVKSAGLDHTKWIPFVTSDYFSRNKRLVVAASTALLSAMSKHIHKNRKNGAVSYRVMSKVAVVPLLEYELSRLFEENEELECDLRCFFEEMIAELETYLLEDPPPASSNEDFSIGGFIDIITKISYEECSYAMEVCMLIAVISLLCDIPIRTNHDELLLDKLNAFLSEPRMSSPAFLLNLHSGALLRFLVKRTEQYPQQRLLIQRFCNFSIPSSYTNRLLIKYVKNPSASTLWQTTSVIKSLAMLGKDEVPEGNKVKSLTKLLHAAVSLLEKEEPSPELLPDYLVCLKQVIKLNDQTMLSKLIKNLKPYLKFAIANFDKGKQLIRLCLKRTDLFSSEFPKSFLMDLWNKVKVQDIEDLNIFNTFCSCLSREELKVVLSDMQFLFEEGLVEANFAEEKIKRNLFLWKGIIWSDFGMEQKKEIMENLNMFMTPLMELVSTWLTQSDPLVVPVLDFLAELGHCPSLHTFGSHLLDMYLVILGLVPLEGPNTLNNLNSGLDALIALFMFRKSLVIDRLPPFLQIFRLYAQSLGKISTPDLTEPNLFRTESCADKLARGAEIMIKHKKDFVRLSPYIISDLLNIFETYTIHPEIKVHFVNILSSFFSILDDHGSEYLASSLNPACQELYKTYFDQYTRYYKYHGKI